MAEYAIPCPRCCNHITISEEQWKVGGLFTCHKCKFNIKLQPHSLTFKPADPVLKEVKPEDILKKRDARKIDKTIIEGFVKQPSPITRIFQRVSDINPKPFISITERRPGQKQIEAGITMTF